MTKQKTPFKFLKSKTVIIAVGIIAILLFVSLPSAPTASTLPAVSLTSNQIQPVSYKIQSGTASLIPFRTAMVLDPRDGTWSSIVVSQTSIKLSAQTLNNPQVTMYPTAQQLQQFEAIISKVNKGQSNIFDKIQLTMLWMQIKKTGA